jgi:hypothetical protein
LSNTLKGLQIIFSFSKFLLGSPQILSHWIHPITKHVSS